MEVKVIDLGVSHKHIDPLNSRILGENTIIGQ